MRSVELASDDRLRAASDLYRGYAPLEVSYGTVRDYCEGADLFPALSCYNRDLKDIQRIWVLKTIMATVPVGGTLLEIGAGEPVIADILGRLGYRVIAVDPYEGAGNGPVEVEVFKELYPNLEYNLALFSTELEGVEPHSIDCCYSISVLEHIPLPELAKIGDAIRKFSKPGGRSIHAVDYVAGGPGSDYHFSMVATVFEAHRLSLQSLHRILTEADRDAETYRLSAESHNLWRGERPYDEFPMRRCLSLQIACDVP